MDEKILKLEKSLFKYEFMSNKEYLNNIIDNDYKELGKSGRLFNKQDVINELSKLKTDRDIVIYNYKCSKINENIWIVNYITLSNNVTIYRTSIWKKEKDIVKILFHQASEYKEEVELFEY